jgi:L-alanine-DL-glutamate epimerase-like enolase superfamily enzyme
VSSPSLQPIEEITTAVYRIPTSQPETDGTFRWESTTLVVVHARAGDRVGTGYTYADGPTAKAIDEHLAKVVIGLDAMDVQRAWTAMVQSIRNVGRPGIASMAISAVDVALWDLKARLLDLPLVTLLGALRDQVPVYGSGGFTNLSHGELQAQLGGWAQAGISRVKMKVGTHPREDPERVRAARDAIGREVELFVDANGAYDRKLALRLAETFAEMDVRWFEEPVTSDDLEGLKLLRDRAPSSMDIAAGEYGYDVRYFRRMIDVVDVLQADATRCGGVTGFLQAAAVSDAAGLPLSAHCAPALHLHVCAAAPRLRHLEYFHDHARIERMLFDGAREPVKGALVPDRSRPGLGLDLKRRDAERFAV